MICTDIVRCRKPKSDDPVCAKSAIEITTGTSLHFQSFDSLVMSPGAMHANGFRVQAKLQGELQLVFSSSFRCDIAAIDRFPF